MHIQTATAVFMFTLPMFVTAHEVQDHYDRVSLSASAGMEVTQDELQASVYAMEEGDQAQKTAEAVSRRIDKALQIISAETSIIARTGSFQTHPVYRKQQIIGWRTRQTINLKSYDAGKLGRMLGELQSIVNLEHIRYDISSQQQTESENRLIGEAIQQFRERAGIVAESLGRKDYRIVNINIGTGHPRPVQQRVMMAERAMADSSPPIQAGTQRVEVSVSGTIELAVKQ